MIFSNIVNDIVLEVLKFLIACRWIVNQTSVCSKLLFRSSPISFPFFSQLFIFLSPSTFSFPAEDFPFSHNFLVQNLLSSLTFQIEPLSNDRIPTSSILEIYWAICDSDWLKEMEYEKWVGLDFIWGWVNCGLWKAGLWTLLVFHCLNLLPWNADYDRCWHSISIALPPKRFLSVRSILQALSLTDFALDLSKAIPLIGFITNNLLA